MDLTTHLLEVFALKLREQLLKTLLISINADRGQDALDVTGGRRVVAGKVEEEVSCEVLHFDERFGLSSAASVSLEIIPICAPCKEK